MAGAARRRQQWRKARPLEMSDGRWPVFRLPARGCLVGGWGRKRGVARSWRNGTSTWRSNGIDRYLPSDLLDGFFVLRRWTSLGVHLLQVVVVPVARRTLLLLLFGHRERQYSRARWTEASSTHIWYSSFILFDVLTFCFWWKRWRPRPPLTTWKIYKSIEYLTFVKPEVPP